jgi:hypothetical protein
MATSFSGGGSRNTRREPPTMSKQLVNFITCGCESSAPFFVIYKTGRVEMAAQAGPGVWRWLHRPAQACGDGCTGRPRRVEMAAQAGPGVWRWLHRSAQACGDGCTGRSRRVEMAAEACLTD